MWMKREMECDGRGGNMGKDMPDENLLKKLAQINVIGHAEIFLELNYKNALPLLSNYHSTPSYYTC